MRCVFAASLLFMTFVSAGSSNALDLSGEYEAQFVVANGTQQPVCFQLTSTGPKRNFVEEGSVTSPTYPNYAGFYAVYKRSFHLTFMNAELPLVVITGTIAKGQLTGTSATKFKTTGQIINVGVLSEKRHCTDN